MTLDILHDRTTEVYDFRLARITDYHIRYCFIANVSAGMLTAEQLSFACENLSDTIGAHNSECDAPLHASCNIPLCYSVVNAVTLYVRTRVMHAINAGVFI